LAGGTGSAKLLRGLDKLPIDLTAVVNVGDNAWVYGTYVCPDIDIATYTLAGIADRTKGWGIEGDTFKVLQTLSRLGAKPWFKLGDMDLATCLIRTQMLQNGATLTQATERIRRLYGVRRSILPVTDADVRTWLATSKGEMHLQEFWVKERGLPHVFRVIYRGGAKARVTSRVRSALLNADRIVLCPANPVTSLGPMLAISGLASLLSRTKARVVALSPMAGNSPFSGPAGKLLKAMGSRRNSVGVARLYSKFLEGMLISAGDLSMVRPIESLGVRCVCTDTFMKGPEDEVRLARELLEL
jgi:LPPG:FO 2-phospho-L-lactate transferase